MSRREEFEERVSRMVERNGLQKNILQNGSVNIYMANFTEVRVNVSMGPRPCRVTIQYADGGLQNETWSVLEAVCRNLTRGRLR